MTGWIGISCRLFWKILDSFIALSDWLCVAFVLYPFLFWRIDPGLIGLLRLEGWDKVIPYPLICLCCAWRSFLCMLISLSKGVLGFQCICLRVAQVYLNFCLQMVFYYFVKRRTCKFGWYQTLQESH